MIRVGALSTNQVYFLPKKKMKTQIKTRSAYKNSKTPFSLNSVRYEKNIRANVTLRTIFMYFKFLRQISRDIVKNFCCIFESRISRVIGL